MKKNQINSTALRAARKRTFYSIKSKLKRRLYKGATLSNALLTKYHLHKLKTQLYIKCLNIPRKRKTLTIQVPEVFSFIENARRSFEFIDHLKASLNSSTNACNLYIDHEKTKNIH